jgi:hypothetical protein
MAASRQAAANAIRLRRLHAGLALFWLAMAVPTVLWWHNSILYVALISVYALIIGHWSAWQASRAETNGDD